MPLMKDSDAVIGDAIEPAFSGGGVVYDCSTSNNFVVTATGNLLASFTNLKPGQSVFFRFVQDGVGGRTFTLSNPVAGLPTGSTLVPAAAAGAITHYHFVYQGSGAGSRLLLLSKL